MLLLFQIILYLGVSLISGLLHPILNSDGSINVGSLMTHLALMEQEVDTAKKLTKELETKLDNTEVTLQTALSDLGKLTQGTAASAMFTRWGRTTCPTDSTAVYNGFVGGANFQDQASGATILCLADKPIYANYTTMQHPDKRFRSTIYGTEYDSSHAQMYYNKMHNEDMPCVVCESNSKSKTIMVPARNVCYQGWSLEYSGYLFGPADGYASGEYICMDSDPESVPGGSSNEDGQLLYMVEGMCGSLHCPPYHDHRELTCAVCSK